MIVKSLVQKYHLLRTRLFIKKTIKLIKKDFVVPSAYEYKNESVVPMYWGEKLSWSIKSIEK